MNGKLSRSNQCTEPTEGVLLVVGTEVKVGRKYPRTCSSRSRTATEVQTYRRPARVGDAVEEGDLLAKVDDRLAGLELEVSKASWSQRRPISPLLLKPSTRLGNLSLDFKSCCFRGR